MAAALPHDSAARNLEGMSLANGWTVTSMIPRPEGRSNGPYSVSYEVSGPQGQRGFLKALDYSKAFDAPDFALALNKMTQAYLHERELLDRCGERKLRRIVRALDSGSTKVPGYEIPVNYIIFERADGDLRAQLDTFETIDDAWRLRTLHQIATALFELHSLGIAHQDLKPANVLQFGIDNTKLADLGRSACRDLACPYESEVVPGTRAYAPPELLYASAAAGFHQRRLGCDAYLLGSMTAYLFTGMSATALLLSQIHESHRPSHWKDGFGTVLPYLKAGFERVLQMLHETIRVQGVNDDILLIIEQLCEPDPAMRGHPSNRGRQETQYSLERYVSIFDRMATRLEYAVYKAT